MLACMPMICLPAGNAMLQKAPFKAICALLAAPGSREVMMERDKDGLTPLATVFIQQRWLIIKAMLSHARFALLRCS